MNTTPSAGVSASVARADDACAADRVKLCKDEKGVRAKGECMKSHPDCQPDVDKLCAGVAPDGGRILACLGSHQAELSPVCKGKVDERLSRKAAKAAPPPTPAQ